MTKGTAKQLASQFELGQLDASERRQAVQRLGALNPVDYPEMHRLLVESLTSDTSELVRFASAEALMAQFSHPGHKNASNTTRSSYVRDESLLALAVRAFMKGGDGQFFEPSLRVRRRIEQALDTYNPAVQWKMMAKSKSRKAIAAEKLVAEKLSSEPAEKVAGTAPLIISDIVPVSGPEETAEVVTAVDENEQTPSANEVEFLPSPPKVEVPVKVSSSSSPTIELPIPVPGEPKSKIDLETVELNPVVIQETVVETPAEKVIPSAKGDDVEKVLEVEVSEPVVEAETPELSHEKEPVVATPAKKRGGVFGLNRLIRRLRGAASEEPKVSQNTTREPTPLEEQQLSPKLRKLISNVSVKKIQPAKKRGEGLPRTSLVETLQEPVVERVVPEAPVEKVVASPLPVVEIPVIESVTVEVPLIEPVAPTKSSEALFTATKPIAVETAKKEVVVEPVKPAAVVIESPVIQLPLPTPAPSAVAENDVELEVVELKFEEKVAATSAVEVVVEEEPVSEPVEVATINPADFPVAKCFRGYCPVGMAKRELNKADGSFASVYKGQRFEFASSEARAEFDAAPEKFAPVMGGIDVVTWTKCRSKETGYYVVEYQGKYFWFTTLANVKVFYANAKSFAAEVN